MFQLSNESIWDFLEDGDPTEFELTPTTIPTEWSTGEWCGLGGGLFAALLSLLALALAVRRSLELVDRIGQRIQTGTAALSSAWRGMRDANAPPPDRIIVRQPRNLSDDEVIEMRGGSSCPTHEPARQVWL